MSPIIEVNNLVFEYPGLRALDQVNFSIDAGSVVALVGPNGAGKSTLLRLLAALSTPLDGEVKIAGLNVFEAPRAAHKLIGYLSDSFGLWNELQAGESIYFTARMHGLSRNDAKTRARELIDLLDCGEFQQRLNGDLSRGQRQKVGIAQSLVHQPQILLLDEPASGLDPEARSELAAVMRLLKSRGVTLIVSSHILSELQEYSDKMLTIKNGRVLSCVDIKQESLSAATTIRVELLSALDAGYKFLLSYEGLSQVNIIDEALEFECAGLPETHSEILSALVTAGHRVISFRIKDSDLQRAYLKQIKQLQGSHES